MQYDILGWIVFFLMVFMLAIQIQLGALSRKSQEIIKKVDGLLNEQLKEKRSDIKLQNIPSSIRDSELSVSSSAANTGAMRNGTP
ncbi:MAG: hypothetical protein ABSC54_09615 [Smithellaceae bacterium]|jgi:hypothetical protein